MVDTGTAVYVATYDPAGAVLVVIGLWSLVSALGCGLVGWRRAAGTPLTTRLWVVTLAVWAAVPGLLLLSGEAVTALLCVVLAVGVTVVAASAHLTERFSTSGLRSRTGPSVRRRRVHWLWAGCGGLLLGATALVVGEPWFVGGAADDGDATAMLLCLVVLPVGAAALQARRRAVRDEENEAALARAGAVAPHPPREDGLRAVLRRHAGVVRRAPDRPVAAGAESTTLTRAVAASVGLLVVTVVLVLQAALTAYGVIELAVLSTVVLASSGTLAVAAAPQVLNGVRTARRQLVDRAADPPEEPA